MRLIKFISFTQTSDKHFTKKQYYNTHTLFLVTCDVNNQGQNLWEPPFSSQMSSSVWSTRRYMFFWYMIRVDLKSTLSIHGSNFCDNIMFVDLEAMSDTEWLSWKAFSNTFTIDLKISSLKFGLMKTYSSGFKQLLRKARLEAMGIPIMIL